MSNKRVFLTGGLGNVGENTTRHFLESNATKEDANKVKLTVFEVPSPLNKEKLAGIEKTFPQNAFFQVIWGDLTKTDEVAKAVQDHDVIVHLAAVIPPIAYKIPEIARRVNVEGTKNLLAATSKMAPKPRFVFASSYSVHGPSNPTKTNPLLRGDSPVNPKDAYAKHKVECEKLIHEYEGEWSILRLGAVSVTIAIGKSGSNGDPTLLNKMIFGVPLIQKRHGVHSKDVATAFCNCATTDKPVHGKTFMIGGDASWKVTSETFLQATFTSLGFGPSLYYPECFRKPTADAPDDAYYYEEWMDTAEAQQLLLFQNHSINDWKRELRTEAGFLQYAVCKILSPFIRYYMSKQSPYLEPNRKGKPYPDQNASFAQIMGSKDE